VRSALPEGNDKDWRMRYFADMDDIKAKKTALEKILKN